MAARTALNTILRDAAKRPLPTGERNCFIPGMMMPLGLEHFWRRAGFLAHQRHANKVAVTPDQAAATDMAEIVKGNVEVERDHVEAVQPDAGAPIGDVADAAAMDAALSGDRAFLSPSPLRRLLPRHLTPAPRRQDHTTSPSASAPFVIGTSASTASRPASVTIASRPSCGTGQQRINR
jgi:hypothetical protein